MATNEELSKIKQILADTKAAKMEFSDDEYQGVMAEDIGTAVSSSGPTISTTIDMSTLSSLWYSANGTSNTSLGYTVPSSTWNSNWGNITAAPQESTLKVKGDAEIDGDIKWQGHSLKKIFETIEDRLAILQPDPEKLEHFEALRKAYEHYKTLEALCTVPKKDDAKE
jgi:hypothetical protein